MAPEIDGLARDARVIYDAAVARLKKSMPFLVRWRDRLVYSIVLACGAGAIISIWGWKAGVAAIAPVWVVCFLLFRRYDRAEQQAPEFTPAERKELLRLAAAVSQAARPTPSTELGAGDEPESAYWRPRRPAMGTTPCGWCGSTSRTYPGLYRPFAPAGSGVEAACLDCLRAGRAAVPVTEGELLTLRNSIAGREPSLPSAELDQRIRKAAEELRRTPAAPLRTDWPQCCADFCRFEGAWDVGDFAVACGSFDAAILAEFIDHAMGRSVERSPGETEAYADLLVAMGWLWQVFRCRSCNRLFATGVEGG